MLPAAIKEVRMARGPAVITVGLVLAEGSARAASADSWLEDNCIDAIVPQGAVTSEARRRIAPGFKAVARPFCVGLGRCANNPPNRLGARP